MFSHEGYASSNSSDSIYLPSSSKRRRVLSDTEESCSGNLPDRTIKCSVQRPVIESDSEAEDGNLLTLEELYGGWYNPTDSHTKITFSNSQGINTHHSEIVHHTEPHSFYFLFVTNEIFQIIANQTNLHAAQIISKKRSTRLDKWVETNPNEIKRFFGLLIWMGLVRLPKIHLYWSRVYNQTFPRTVMSKTRFELLLRLVHFSNNEENDYNNRLSKIINIIDILNSNFKKNNNPDEILYVNESLVPFRDRTTFRQYLKEKRRRYGIVFKLCSAAGYIYSFYIYTVKENKRDKITRERSSEILLYLCKDILGQGHTICTNNWYTTIDLAEKLIAMKTHLVGTLRKNQEGYPPEVMSKKLEHGEIIAREKNGVRILKWKNKRDVLMLSTKHSVEMTVVHRKFYSREKPTAVVVYNEGKSSVDLYNQMIACGSLPRKTLKWYKKLALELLLNTCMVNALVLFKQITNKDIQISDFRMQVAMYLTQCQDNEIEASMSPREILKNKRRHELKAMPGMTRNVRRFCKICYQNNSKMLGRAAAKNCSKKVVTYCKDCDGSPFLCLECFNKTHRNIRM